MISQSIHCLEFFRGEDDGAANGSPVCFKSGMKSGINVF
jgi:hypothetical protein